MFLRRSLGGSFCNDVQHSLNRTLPDDEPSTFRKKRDEKTRSLHLSGLFGSILRTPNANNARPAKAQKEAGPAPACPKRNVMNWIRNFKQTTSDGRPAIKVPKVQTKPSLPKQAKKGTNDDCLIDVLDKLQEAFTSFNRHDTEGHSKEKPNVKKEMAQKLHDSLLHKLTRILAEEQQSICALLKD